MEIIPAIDLRGGLCVRLHQGDYGQETVYSTNPVEVAQRWQQAGALRLHVVDLDGARTGHPMNAAVIARIASRVGLSLQVGGGIRTYEAAQELLDHGTDRVVLGTAAVLDPGLVQRLCQDYGSQCVVIAVDARDGLVAIQGWRQGTSTQVQELVQLMKELGVDRFLYTDIARDGTLTEPNFAAVEKLVVESKASILASGGVASLEHIQRLSRLGVEGAILGRALYTGDIDLREALRLVSTAS